MQYISKAWYPIPVLVWLDRMGMGIKYWVPHFFEFNKYTPILIKKKKVYTNIYSVIFFVQIGVKI